MTEVGATQDTFQRTGDQTLHTCSKHDIKPAFSSSDCFFPLRDGYYAAGLRAPAGSEDFLFVTWVLDEGDARRKQEHEIPQVDVEDEVRGAQPTTLIMFLLWD